MSAGDAEISAGTVWKVRESHISMGMGGKKSVGGCGIRGWTRQETPAGRVLVDQPADAMHSTLDDVVPDGD